MIDINELKLDVDFSASGIDEILQNIRIILTTPAGTVPFDRDFGIDVSVLDLSLEQAKHLLTVEYIEKIRKYEPRVQVEQVTFEYDTINGVIRPKVVLKSVD